MEMGTESELLITVQLIASSLSFLGSMFIIIVYFNLKGTSNFAMYIIFWLAIADLVLSVGRLISFFELINSVGIEQVCDIQAIMVNFGTISSVLCVCSLSWLLYATVCLGTENLESKRLQFHVFTIGVPVILTAIPLATGTFGKVNEYFCWIEVSQRDRVHLFSSIYATIGYIVPIWFTIAFVIFSMVKVRRGLNSTITVAQDEFISRIQTFSIILIFCWSFPTAQMIYSMFGQDALWMEIITAFFSGFQGMLNSLVFATTSIVKKTIKLKILGCCKCFRKKEEADEDDLRLFRSISMESDEISIRRLSMVRSREISLESYPIDRYVTQPTM